MSVSQLQLGNKLNGINDDSILKMHAFVIYTNKHIHSLHWKYSANRCRNENQNKQTKRREKEEKKHKEQDNDKW